MPSCTPLIEPCNHGRFKLACGCGWRVHPRFRSVQDAESAWAAHARTMLDG